MDSVYQEALEVPVSSGLTLKTESEQTMLLIASQTPPAQARGSAFISQAGITTAFSSL